MALAALRATREAEAKSGRQRLPCIVGVPLPGERLGGQGVRRQGRGRRVSRATCRRTRRACLAQPGGAAGPADSVHFLRFRPPRVSLEAPSGEEPALPHIRLDRAIEFLLGDRLAMSEPRKPRVFDPADPAIVEEPAAAAEPPAPTPDAAAPPADGGRRVRPTLADLGQRGLRWGMVLAHGPGRRGRCWGSAPGSRASSRRPWCARTGSAGPRSPCC